MDPTAPFDFGLASVTESGDEGAAAALLADAQSRDQALLVSLGGGWHQGHHPQVGRFSVLPRRMDAPNHLPAFLARLDEAPGVHAGGEGPESAALALIHHFLQAADRLLSDEHQA